MTTSTIPDPSTRYRRTGQRGLNGQMMSWLFMRMSGVLLVILVFGHLFVNLWLGEGVQGIDFAFVAGKWTSKGLLYFAVVITLILGTLVIFTFDPCPAGAEPSLLPSICEG